MPKPKKIPSREHLSVRLRYDQSTGLFRWTKHRANGAMSGRPAGTPVFQDGKPGFIRITISGVAYPAHRIAMVMSGVDIDVSLSVDHINRNPFDNRLDNLRPATHRQNLRNMGKRRNSERKYIGVREYGKYGKFMFRLSGDSGIIQRNGFTSEIDAAIARDAMAIRVYGSFAVLNFPRNLYMMVA